MNELIKRMNIYKASVIYLYLVVIIVILLYKWPCLIDYNDNVKKTEEIMSREEYILGGYLKDDTKFMIDEIKMCDEEKEYNMYEYIRKTLKKNGYNHYEISNFAKPGYESKHNLTYWNNEEYYGFGLGSHGYINGVRYENTKGLNNYIKGNYILEKHFINKQEQMENEMILGLRKRMGVSKNHFYQKYNVNIEDVFEIKDLLNNKKLIDKDDYIYINENNIYISNDILINFINNKD